MKKSQNQYLDNGIFVSPTQVTVGDTLKLSYDGILAKSGATEVYAHVGYGRKWEDSKDYKMLRTSSGFEATIPVTKPQPLNVCFKDSIENWDNNSGLNYTLDIIS